MFTNLQAYKQAITTLTQIDARIVKQKFYTISIPDYVDIDIGNGSFNDVIFKWQSFDNATDGFDGFMTDNTNQAKMLQVSVNYNGRNDYRYIWNKYCSYNIKDLEQLKQAMKMGQTNFDFIEDKLEARKRNFDIMLQESVFNGNKLFDITTGLLNNPEVAINTDALTQSLSSLSGATLKAIVGNMLTAYANNAKYTAMPNRLVIPYSDFLGLSTATSPDFPVLSQLEFLENAFKKSTQNEDFKILPVAYANPAYNDTGKNIYCLYNKDADNMVFDLPVEYTTTPFNTIDNYTFYNVGYGQVGGVRIFRPQEVMYFTF